MIYLGKRKTRQMAWKSGFYGLDNIELTQIFHKLGLSNRKILRGKFNEEFSVLEETLNLEYEIAAHYLWVLGMEQPVDSVYPILFSCFHKNLFSVFTALDLTKKGFFGSARPIIRHAFEGLLIAKFCSTARNRELFRRWENGMAIFISKDVLRKVQHPDLNEIGRFWGLLCGYTHASTCAQQVHFGQDETDLIWNVGLNLVFIKILLECNYHVLGSHLITPSIKYTGNIYRNKKKAEELRKRIYRLFVRSKKGMLKAPRIVISDFKRKWSLLEVVNRGELVRPPLVNFENEKRI
jgi:hypothetical protein